MKKTNTPKQGKSIARGLDHGHFDIARTHTNESAYCRNLYHPIQQMACLAAHSKW